MRRACCASTFFSSICAGVLDRLLDGVLGDLVEQHAAHVVAALRAAVGHVPGDRLALAVGVGGDQDRRGLLGRLLQLLDRLRLALDGDELRLEVRLDVHAQLARRAGPGCGPRSPSPCSPGRDTCRSSSPWRATRRPRARPPPRQRRRVTPLLRVTGRLGTDRHHGGSSLCGRRLGALRWLGTRLGLRLRLGRGHERSVTVQW